LTGTWTRIADRCAGGSRRITKVVHDRPDFVRKRIIR